ncbi:hypothetical protein [Clostridium saccharoperbutylacetonicum]|uniref:hypothetical protein n=1 Tax=Clostridium saccharoperbutylacetonicum TaxID=36745 RepID=UPI000983F139|nr:hypothetical protein [Clostridium saccharoperbutylacetonicum]AQR96146.1 hypothetical protein CLSAP_34650 [Clostridium saccharoperbutylacetonicum]NSB32016.1 hypothetical protein [Clostridium saccharoperbutylacetonicum]
MSNYFSQQKRGGIITSKIEHQDSVGMILSMELLNKNSPYYPYFNSEPGWRIMFEGNDDLEIIHNNARMFIQVKTSKVKFPEFIEILNNFKNNSKQINVENIFFKLCTFNEVVLPSFTEKLREYQNSKEAYPKVESDKILDELLTSYKIDLIYKKIVDKLEIDERPLLKDSSDTEAIFADSLRKAYIIRDFGSNATSEIFRNLKNEFEYGRRNRKSLSRNDILHIINMHISTESLIGGIDLKTKYKKTNYGYLPSFEARKIVQGLAKSNNLTQKKIMKDWRRAYFKEFLVSFLLGACHCPNCNHPLIGNTNGLSGITCPYCGFQPYLTLFLGCSCGNYTVIKTQPDLTTDGFSNAILEYFKTKGDSKCKNCSKDLLDDYWEYRVILLPLPYPFSSFDLKSLYDDAKNYYQLNKK